MSEQKTAELRELQRRTDPLVLLETIRRCQGQLALLASGEQATGLGAESGRAEWTQESTSLEVFLGICRRCGAPTSRAAANPGRAPESGHGPIHSRPTWR